MPPPRRAATVRAERAADVPHAERGTKDDEAMSAVTGTGTMSARGSTLPVRELTPRAIVYCGVVMAFAAAVAAPLLTHVAASGDQWAAFVVFSSCAAVAQLFTVQTPRNHGFQTTNVFLIPAILLLPAPLVALIAVVQHIPEWLNSRKAWYVQSFNIANYTLDSLAAYAVAQAIEHSGLIGSMQAREEFGRAERFERPLSLIMVDLDLLRDINNSYGHLAGDAVLKGIAEVFRAELRHYDVPARFGGEEFSILLPETAPEEALEIAERIRRAVAAAAFDVETSSEPIHATVSIGVAGYPKDAHDANELVHQADLAVYRAKLQGRNRVLELRAVDGEVGLVDELVRVVR